MAEVLIRIREKPGIRADLLPMNFNRGDVVVVCPDNWPWSVEELTNPDWRIIALPLISEKQLEQFILPRTRVTPLGDREITRKRNAKINLDDLTLPLAFRVWLANDARTNPIRSINLTAVQLLALLVNHATTQLVL